MANLNKVMLPDGAAAYYNSGKSLSDVASRYGVSISTARLRLIAMGVHLRTPAEGIKLAGHKIGDIHRGKKKSFSAEHRKNISLARRGRGRGLSYKRGGYAEFTMGPNKGRGQHVVIMEGIIGRRLRKGEVVHHIDENKHNNNPSNLQLMTRSAHTALHSKLRYNGQS